MEPLYRKAFSDFCQLFLLLKLPLPVLMTWHKNITSILHLLMLYTVVNFLFSVFELKLGENNQNMAAGICSFLC